MFSAMVTAFDTSSLRVSGISDIQTRTYVSNSLISACPHARSRRNHLQRSPLQGGVLSCEMLTLDLVRAPTVLYRSRKLATLGPNHDTSYILDPIVGSEMVAFAVTLYFLKQQPCAGQLAMRCVHIPVISSDLDLAARGRNPYLR